MILNFFATSHGKGVVDGIGGTVKRVVWSLVRSDQARITNAKEFADVAQLCCPNIHVSFFQRNKLHLLSPPQQVLLTQPNRSL